eukprot:jgi/Botrbrau1/861/Bobra.0352s0054.1
MATDGPLSIPIPSARVSHGSRDYARLPKKPASPSEIFADEPLDSPSGYLDWAPRPVLPQTGGQRPSKVRGNNHEIGKGRVGGFTSPTLASPAPSAQAEAFQDCTSDVNSVASFEVDDNSCDGGGHSRANSAREGEGEGHSGSSDYDAFVSDWYSRYQEEHKQRILAEEETANLRVELQRARDGLQSLQEQMSRMQSIGTEGELIVELPQTMVARMVGGMMGRVAGADAANRAHQEEIQALHQRIERLSGMEAALERKREREKEQHDTFMRRLGHGVMAAACIGAGVLGVYVVVTRFQAANRAPTTPQVDVPLLSEAPAAVLAGPLNPPAGLAIVLEGSSQVSDASRVLRPYPGLSASVVEGLPGPASAAAPSSLPP